MSDIQTDVAIIGAGTAGLAAYRKVVAQKKKPLLIESGPYGTTCARVGCMPSKLLIAAADAHHHARHADVFGVVSKNILVDDVKVMSRVKTERDRFVSFVLEAVEKIPAEHRLHGEATFIDDHTLQVGQVRVAAKTIIIATGSSPHIPAQFKPYQDYVVTNDELFEWDTLPKSVAVFGTGVIGLELGQALHRLGVRVSLFGRSGRIGPITDKDIQAVMLREFQREMSFYPQTSDLHLEAIGGAMAVTLKLPDDSEHTEVFEKLVVATGRKPNVAALALDNTSLECDAKGVPIYNRATGQCGESNIFIAGDVRNELPLLHEAADDGKIAGINASTFPTVVSQKRRSMLAIVFCDPQIALVGATKAYLCEHSVAFIEGEMSFYQQGRSRVMNQHKGLLKLFVTPDEGRLLGAEMFGPRAEHLVHLLAWAHQAQMTVRQMLEMPFYHPVIEEGLRSALRDCQNQLDKRSVKEANCLDCGPGG